MITQHRETGSDIIIINKNMKNWFKEMKERRAQRRKLREYGRLFEAFKTLEQMEQSGLLWFDEEHRRLMIERSLALLMMRNAETWMQFLNGCWQWQYLRESQKAWEAYMQKEEIAAVRKALKQWPKMSRRDIERVKEARRLEIMQGDMEPPKVMEFEFFVVGSDVEPDGKASGTAASMEVPGGRIFLVGSYSPEMEWPEMATWEEVKMWMDKEKED